MALADDILLYGNRAQTKIAEHATLIEESLRKGLTIDDSRLLGIELLNFQVALFGSRCPWTDTEKAYWINFMTERHELVDIAYTDFEPFVLPVVVAESTANGDFVTHPQLADAVQDLEDADEALNVRITALENFDYSDLIPQSLIDDVAANKADIIEHAELIDEAQDAIIQTENDLASHIADNSKHIQTGERETWNAKVSASQLSAGLAGKSGTGHGHTIADISGLQNALNQLQTNINNIPTPEDGQDGNTPVISIGTVTEGETPSVEVDPGSPAEAPVFNFVLKTGAKGDPFEFDAIGPLSGRSTYDGETPGFTYLASDTGNYYILGVSDWGDPIPFKGLNGWTPRLAVHTVSATHEVLEILGFFGGEGDEPQLPVPVGSDPSTVRFFIGTSGIVTDAAQGKNVKGGQGNDGEKGDTFIVNAEGTDRSIYDAMQKGFAFLNTTTGKVSSKLSDTSADWSVETQWTGPAGEDGEDSVVPGPEGDSAYDVAVANGFVGTEADWLLSLKGDPGDDGVAGANGVGVTSSLNIVGHGFSQWDVLGISSGGFLELYDGTNEYVGLVISVTDVDNFVLQNGGIVEAVFIDEGEFFYGQTDGTIDTAVVTDLVVIVGVSAGVGVLKAAISGGSSSGGGPDTSRSIERTAVSSVSDIINLDCDGLKEARFENATALTADTDVTISNDTIAEIILLHVYVTGTRILTMESNVVMQMDEDRWDNALKELELIEGHYQLSFAKVSGSIYQLTVSTPFYAS